jgi:hypothetical protein
MGWLVAAAMAVLALASLADAAGDRPAAEVEPRVAHHVRRATELAEHFEALLGDGCPRLATPEEWEGWVEGELDRVVLLVAHVEEAWEEAKTTPDDDVRRAAKVPGRRVRDAQPLVEKLRACAGENGAAFEPGVLWRRIEREVPRRRAEIALPR